jgi:hypothetical protein
MTNRWLTALRELMFVSKALLFFSSLLAPFFLLIFFLYGSEEFIKHQDFLDSLQIQGREAQAVIKSIDLESDYIFLACLDQPADYRSVYVQDLSFYPSDWLESLEPGQSMRIIYVEGARDRYAHHAVPLEFYPAFRRNPGIGLPTWGMLAFVVFVYVMSPELLFLGFVSPK